MTALETAVAPAEAPSSLRERRGPMRPARLFSVRERRDKRLSSHLFRTLDGFALVVLAVVGPALMSGSALTPSRWDRLAPAIVGVIVLCALLRYQNAYAFRRRERLLTHLLTLMPAVAAASAAVLSAGWLDRLGDYAGTAERWAATAGVTIVALHTVWWTKVCSWRNAGLLTPNIAIVGARPQAELLIAKALSERHVNVLGVFHDETDVDPATVLGVPVLGDVDALLAHDVAPYLDRVVIAVGPHDAERGRTIATRLSVLPNDLRIAVIGDDGRRRRPRDRHRWDVAALPDPDRLCDRDRRALAKRRTDLIVGALMCMAFAPVAILFAALIKFDSPGPVFFRQRRHGFNGEEIVVWKFRTMRSDATDADGRVQVVDDDERVTRVGRFLRRTSLDEVPQLLNVMHGEMSLVGPRPHALGMQTDGIAPTRLIDDYAHRYRLKPGMTGWAAINGSRGPAHTADQVIERVALDLDYIANQSTRLDLQILVRTLPAMLGDRDVVR